MNNATGVVLYTGKQVRRVEVVTGSVGGAPISGESTSREARKGGKYDWLGMRRWIPDEDIAFAGLSFPRYSCQCHA